MQKGNSPPEHLLDIHVHDAVFSTRAFLSEGESSDDSSSAFRFGAAIVDSSAGAFFFFFTIEVRSLTSVSPDDVPEVVGTFSSWSRAFAASSGAEGAASLGTVFSSST